MSRRESCWKSPQQVAIKMDDFGKTVNGESISDTTLLQAVAFNRRLHPTGGCKKRHNCPLWGVTEMGDVRKWREPSGTSLYRARAVEAISQPRWWSPNLMMVPRLLYLVCNEQGLCRISLYFGQGCTKCLPTPLVAIALQYLLCVLWNERELFRMSVYNT